MFCTCSALLVQSMLMTPLQECNWSAVYAEQLYGRIHRYGQTQATFAFQLIASGTIEQLLIWAGLLKLDLLEAFHALPHNERMSMSIPSMTFTQTHLLP